MVLSTQGLNYNLKPYSLVLQSEGSSILLAELRAHGHWKPVTTFKLDSLLPYPNVVTVLREVVSGFWFLKVEVAYNECRYWFFFRTRGLCLSWACKLIDRARIGVLLHPVELFAHFLPGLWLIVFLSSDTVPKWYKVASYLSLIQKKKLNR